MMNKNAIKRGLIHIICSGTDCRFCSLKHINCVDISFDDIVPIARKNYHSLVEKYKRTTFASKDENMAMKFLKGANMK